MNFKLTFNICLSSFIALLLFSNCSKDPDPIPVPTKNYFLLAESVTTLPADLKESSGLEITTNNVFWTHNDKGNAAILYALNEQGEEIKTIQLQGAFNTDWEDLAQDASGNLYVGNFGNNDNIRTDLSIYILPPPDAISTLLYVPEIIQFSFEDQNSFPPLESQFFFDTEAFFALNDKLYLFIKDRSNPFQGITKLYELPNSPGTYQARLLSTFPTDSKKSNGAITGADISPDGKTIALLATDLIWILTEYNGVDFFSGKTTQLPIPLNRKFEGIVFKDSCTIYLSNEKDGGEDAQLQRFKICE